LDYKLGEVIDMNHPINYRQAEMDEEDGCKSVLIQPGEFLLMSSNEELNIPNGIIAFVAGRSSIARLGIQVEQAGLIDAGFKGTITFEVYNQTKNPIRLYKGMRIAQVYFIKAEYADSLYGSADRSSKYQSQVLATGSRIHKDVIESKDTNLAIGSNISLSQLRYIDDAYKILSDD
jgi:dCTP deaminase